MVKKEIEETSVENVDKEEEEEETEMESDEGEEAQETETSEAPKDDREMFKIKCSDCGKDADVPFKPTEGRPVYCRDCFMKHRKPRRSFGYNRRF